MTAPATPLDAATLSTRDAPAPHGGGPILIHDTRPDPATPPAAAVIMLHGRGASARDILSLSPMLGVPDVAYVAPQAASSTWYPLSFLAPIPANQPGIDSAHALIESLLVRLNRAGVPTERIALMGFSQGACLACDHARRFPRRYGAIIALTGGVIGPESTVFAPRGDLAQTPVFLSASDPDPHVPATRVRATADLFAAMNGAVQTRFYPGMPHTVCDDAIQAARAMIQRITRDRGPTRSTA